MKAAFVLGLALAANAQVDNELASKYDPAHPSGADLVRNAGWGRHLPIGYRPLYRDDQVADDELLSLSGADLVKYAKQSQSTTYRPVAHVVRDDEADDELMVYYTKDSQGNKHYQGGYTVRRDDEVTDDELMVYYTKDSRGNKHYEGGYTVRRDDEVDDELMVYYTKDSQGNKHYQGGYTVRRDDEADDELHLSGLDLVKYAKQSQQTVYRPGPAYVVKRDDEVDDELMVYYTKDSQGNKHYQGGYTVRRDDEVDDELMVYYTKDSQGNKHYQGGYTVRRDDEVDDELHLSGADLVKYAKQSQQTVYRPGPAHVVKRDDEVDDELMVYYTKDSQGNKHYQGGYTVRRDDEVADDELLSLSGADLVKYAKQSQSTTYRPVAHVVRDDEADDELMVYYTKDSRGNKHYEGGYTVRRDDEADDELAYLGHLIKETQKEKKPETRRFRHAEKN